MKRILISLSDKKGAVEFVKGLLELFPALEVVSTGGTFKLLQEAGLPVVSVSSITGFPECLDGRVKTLHPKIHGGLLALRSSKEHMEQLEELDITCIDLVAVNLYPFKETVLKEGVSLEEAIENIDIGGPSMLRAAAKNYGSVSVICEPEDYETVLEELRAKGIVSQETNFKLAAKAFMHTANYDGMISAYLREKAGIEQFPNTLTLTFEKAEDLRYGENPHQGAALYKEALLEKGTLTGSKQLHGKELSFNNYNDTNGALELLREFEEPTVVCVKHSVPCGVASGASILEAWEKACASDPMSVFGGIVAFNREVDEACALLMNKIFLEVVIAPSYSAKAFKILSSKKNIRLLEQKDILSASGAAVFDMKKISGGLLVQAADRCLLVNDEMKVVTEKSPSDEELSDLLFAFKVVKHAKSNAIVIAKGKQTLGIAGGAVNRFWPLKQAVEHAEEMFGEGSTKGAVLASDAFFPFNDCTTEAARAGITAIIQPGGATRDEDSIEVCNKNDISMIFTGVRHFKH